MPSGPGSARATRTPSRWCSCARTAPATRAAPYGVGRSSPPSPAHCPTRECTHLGGHRLAGTLLSLPDGACFGRLDPDTAVGVVTAHRQGRADATYLRGTTRWEPAVQAGLAAALAAYGPASVDDAVPGAVDVDGDHTRVEVYGRGPLPEQLVVDVVREDLPEAPLSCGDRPKAHAAYRTSLRA